MTAGLDIAHAQLAENLGEAENDHDYDRLFSVVAEEVVLHRPAATGRGELREVASALYDAFPDHHREVERLLPGDRFVVVQWRFTGTHLGRWCGVPPTGRRVGLTGCSILELADLRLVGMWCFADAGTLLRQLAVDVPVDEQEALVVVA